MEVTLFKSRHCKLTNPKEEINVALRGGRVLPLVYTRHCDIKLPINIELLDVLKSIGLSPQASEGEILTMTVAIGLERIGPGYLEGYLEARLPNYETLISNSNGGILGGDVQLSVAVKSLKRRLLSSARTVFTLPPLVSNYSFPLIPNEEKQVQGFRVSISNFLNWSPQEWNIEKNSSWEVEISAELIFPDGADLAVTNHLSYIRRMLSEELFCDVTVIAENKAEVKFHRPIMAAHSSVFTSMFQCDMTEARSGIVEMPEMTENSVRALREYLYLGSLAVPLENPEVCFELFEAGHKYNIEQLEKRIKMMLLQKPLEWYSVEVALRLFLFVRGKEDLELKGKAAHVLKAKYGELKDVSSFQTLFMKSPDAAMDLFQWICDK